MAIKASMAVGTEVAGIAAAHNETDENTDDNDDDNADDGEEEEEGGRVAVSPVRAASHLRAASTLSNKGGSKLNRCWAFASGTEEEEKEEEEEGDDDKAQEDVKGWSPQAFTRGKLAAVSPGVLLLAAWRGERPRPEPKAALSSPLEGKRRRLVMGVAAMAADGTSDATSPTKLAALADSGIMVTTTAASFPAVAAAETAVPT